MPNHESYAELRDAIVHDLDRKDGVGIWEQLTEMVWRWGVFEVSHEARRLNEEDPASRVGFNGPICELYDRGFAALQLLAVRRQLENSHNTVSLQKALDTVQAHRPLVTREAYVTVDGAPFDSTAIRQRHEAWLMEQARQNGGTYVGSVPSWASPAFDSERRHRLFDTLSGVNEEARTPHDELSQAVLSPLQNSLSLIRQTADEVTVHLAHAIDPNAQRWRPATTTWSELWDATKSMYKVAGKIGAEIFYSSAGGGLPVYQGNLLEHIDDAWCTSERLPKLEEKWDELSNEIHSWEVES